MISLLNFLKIERAAIIGTSRGGIVGMLMAAFFRDRLAGLFLNDVGPVLDAAGLLRIRSYLGVQSRICILGCGRHKPQSKQQRI